MADLLKLNLPDTLIFLECMLEHRLYIQTSNSPFHEEGEEVRKVNIIYNKNSTILENCNLEILIFSQY